MKSVFAIVLLVFFTFSAHAQTTEAPRLAPLLPNSEWSDLSQFLWKKRVLIIFSDGEGDPRFIEQMSRLEDRVKDLVERDVVLLTDTNPEAKSALREKFRPRGFTLVLLGKDGNIYLRKPLPWSGREISRSIDKMPLRREELRN